jgi:iron(III) transport system permease protein
MLSRRNPASRICSFRNKSDEATVFLGAAIGWIDLRNQIAGTPPARLCSAGTARPARHRHGRSADPVLAEHADRALRHDGDPAADYVARYMPLGVCSANSALQQIDPSLEESARILGASWGMTMREVTLPLIRPACSPGGSWYSCQ